MFEDYSAQFTARPHRAQDIDLAVKAMERNARQSHQLFLARFQNHIEDKTRQTRNIFKFLLGVFLPG